MTSQELKNSILQLAIQGKLVEQRPEEGTAEELLKQIQAEKQALIKAGKIKKEKPLPEITEDEKPFDIPESWMWARITELGSFVAGYTPKADELSDVGTIPYFKVSDMNTAGNEMFLHISTKFLKDSNSKKIYLKNTIVYPKNGGAVFTNKKRILAQDSVVDLNTGGFTVVGPVDLMYYYTFFSMIDFKQCYKGTALPTIDMDKLRGKWFPLPPLAEQKRIVAKIEELLPLIDRYEEAWTKLEEFNKRFPNDLQKSLLQMAVQGKLTKQYNQENIDDIKSELKINSKLLDIDELPFDIPENWEWIQIGNLGASTDTNSFSDGPFGSNLKREHQIKEKEVRIIQLSNIGENGWKDSNEKYTSYKHLENVISRCEVFPGDFVIAKMMPAGRTIEVPELGTRITLGSDAMKFKPNPILNKKYLLYAMRSSAFLNQVYADVHGITRVRTTLNAVKTYAIPIPPLVEQDRIVTKLEFLFPLCEKLRYTVD